ncbi:MAG: hypothetical protein ACRESK_05155 [Gammaproteobacteria bacterium]
MTTLELKLTLPNDLAQEAQAAGLLSPAAVEAMVREAMRKRRIDRLFETMQKLSAEPLPPMTAAEIQAEIDTYRREGRRAAGT